MTTQERVIDHLREAEEFFDHDRIVGCFLQGSQNYGLDIQDESYQSDVDTKLVVLPTFDEIVFNRKAHSTTHVRANDEHIDFKDLRLMFQTFRKQNLNFIEILFTPYFVLNEKYASEWRRLTDNKEKIARYSPYGAVKTMKGIALEKFHAMEHEYPARMHVLRQFSYDPKQLHHLLRVEEFLTRYITGEPYEACMHPRDTEFLKLVKTGYYSLEKAREVAVRAKDNILEIAEDYCSKVPNFCDTEVDELLDSVQYNVMYLAMKDYFAGKEG